VTSPFAVEARKVEKPWGYELIFALTELYCGKVLFVRAGQALSLQYHEVKDEAWYVESGRASLELGTVGDESTFHTVELNAGDAYRFRPGTVHRVTAIDDTTILEVSTPHLDDVVRLEDRYGREGTSTP
jgi:mannose-6-phosphate isomerase